MRTIEIPDDTTCARCPKPATVVQGGSLYCGENCLAHNDARAAVGRLSRLVDYGGGGSLDALALLDRLDDALRRLEPVYPDDACPRCWGHMQGGADIVADDGSWGKGERCSMCAHARPTKG